MINYDVIIIGGGTAGCACAYNCGKLGLKTLLVEKGGCLGGTMTSGLVVPAMSTGENLINIDFYNKLISEMKNIGGQITYQNNPGWFNPELLKIILDKILLDVNVEILFNTEILDVECSGGHVFSASYASCVGLEKLSVNSDTIYADNMIAYNNKKEDMLSVYIGAKYFVDATGNLEFSQKINCNFLNNSNEFPPMSLRFIVGGIDLNTFGEWLLTIDKDREVTTVELVDGYTHLSTAYTWDTDKDWALAKYFDLAVDKNVLKDTDRNYFQLFTIPGMPDSVAFNCPRVVESLNPNSKVDTTHALIEARQAILRIYNFCKKYFPGFENSYISNISDCIGIRASNRIKGKYVYNIEDLRNGKTFENPVLISNYPVDVHSKDKNASILESNNEYQFPIESLMSYNYDNLFVAGRGISADELSQAALRVQVNCFAMGEAIAKYIKKII